MARRRGTYLGGSTVHIPGRDSPAERQSPPMALANARAQTAAEDADGTIRKVQRNAALLAVESLEKEFDVLTRAAFFGGLGIGEAPDFAASGLIERINRDQERLGREGGAAAKRRMLGLRQHAGTLGRALEAGESVHLLFGIPLVDELVRKVFPPRSAR